MVKHSKNNIEKILQLWSSKTKTAKETAKDLAYEIEFAKYHKQLIIPTDSRGREYLAALLRELARE